MLFAMKSNPFGDHHPGLGLEPTEEHLPGFRESGHSQVELATAESEGGRRMRNDGQWIFFSKIQKCFTINVRLLRWGRGSLHLSLFLANPLCMGADEFLDGRFRHAQRGADRQAAVTLNDEGNRLSPGMDQLVNGDGHGKK